MDGVNGSDSFDGLTSATAKKTLSAGVALLAAGTSGSTLAVFPATYSGASNRIEWNTAKVANIGFVGETVIDLAGVASPNDIGIDALAGTLNVYGPPLAYTCVVKSSGNDGLSATSGILNAFDIDVDSCFDGCSAHNGATMRLYRCNIRNCGKDSFAHVGSATYYHEDCTFTGKNGSVNGIGVLTGTVTGSFLRCTFLPPAGSTDKPMTIQSSNTATFTECYFGTAAMTGSWSADSLETSNTTFTDCYFNGYRISIAKNVTMTRCRGSFTFRALADATENFLAENCVFKTGVTSGRFLNADFRNGTTFIGGAGIIRDCIFVSHTTALFAVGTNVSDMNTNWSFLNNCYFGNTLNYTVGLTPDGVDVTADPLLVNTAIDTVAGWKYTAGSPCIGAGTAGSNIGLGT